jgi:hypothetical protein
MWGPRCRSTGAPGVGGSTPCIDIVDAVRMPPTSGQIMRDRTSMARGASGGDLAVEPSPPQISQRTRHPNATIVHQQARMSTSAKTDFSTAVKRPVRPFRARTGELRGYRMTATLGTTPAAKRLGRNL